MNSVCRALRAPSLTILALALAAPLAAQDNFDPILRTGLEPYACPNGVVEDAEQCDDNNALAGDQCAPNCRFFNCGDGVLDSPFEECDDGNNDSLDGCDGRFCFVDRDFGPYFSEYLEGSSFNRAFEIRNPSIIPFDMAAKECYVLRYDNGSAVPSEALGLGANLTPFAPGVLTNFIQGSSIIPPGGVYTVGNPSAIPAIVNVSNYVGSIASFNGDDALELHCRGLGGTQDVIGDIGVDPGIAWAVGAGGATAEFTLVIQTCRISGSRVWAFNSVFYEAFPQNTTTFLGSGSCTG